MSAQKEFCLSLDFDLYKKFSKTILEKYGHINGHISKELEEAIKLWLNEAKKEEKKEKTETDENIDETIRDRYIQIRVNKEEKEGFSNNAEKAGYENLSQYVRDLVLEGLIGIRLGKTNQERLREIRAYEKGDVVSNNISRREIEELVNRIIKIYYEEVW
ncbi:MAG: plasmid mobilization protein [Promethearchaeota archaeon]